VADSRREVLAVEKVQSPKRSAHRAPNAKALIEEVLSNNSGEHRNAGWSEKSFRSMPCLGLRRLIEILKRRATRRKGLNRLLESVPDQNGGSSFVQSQGSALSCNTKTALIQAWSLASKAFSEEVQSLAENRVCKMTGGEYASLRSRAEDARRASQKARLALEMHRDKHGC